MQGPYVPEVYILEEILRDLAAFRGPCRRRERSLFFEIDFSEFGFSHRLSFTRRRSDMQAQDAQHAQNPRKQGAWTTLSNGSGVAYERLESSVNHKPDRDHQPIENQPAICSTLFWVIDDEFSPALHVNITRARSNFNIADLAVS